jgi:hypothetical protein
MDIISQAATNLQNLFRNDGTHLAILARETRVIQRYRKLTPEVLLEMILFTLLKCPRPKTKKYVATAAQLGLTITERAVEKRFTPPLVAFLRQVLQRTLQQIITTPRVPSALLEKFTSVRVGDSTSVTLPDACAEEFPGCGGKSGSGKAVVKLQVLWDLCSGRLLNLVIEPGRHSDAKSAIHDELPPPRSLSLWDLGYFSLKRFAAWTAHDAFFISRLQPGTAVLEVDGQPLDLRQRLRRHVWSTPLDMTVLLGCKERVTCRLIALRAPQAVVDQRRRKAYEKAQKSGRTPSSEFLEWCAWTILVTNCAAAELTWKEVMVLYRSRWQIELLFKLWKKHNRLADHATTKSAAWQMAEFWGKLIAAIIQHGLLLSMTWMDHRRSLMQAAEELREKIDGLVDEIGDHVRLTEKLHKAQAILATVARVNPRKKKPSWFQLILNPELLEYTF